MLCGVIIRMFIAPSAVQLWVLSVVILLTLSGCVMPVKSEKEAPVEVLIPANWSALAHPDGRVEKKVSQGEDMILAPWLTFLDDPLLLDFVHEAMDHNFDLKVTVARLAQASSQMAIAEGGEVPDVAYSFGAQRQRSNFLQSNASQNGRATANYSSQYSADLSVSWEVDVWGRLASRTRASVLNWQGAQDDLEAARLSLIANVAKRWYALISAQQQLSLANKQVEALKAELDIIENEYHLGVSDALSVVRARAELARESSGIGTFERTLHNAQSDLEVLLGRYPDASIVANTTLKPITHSIEMGVPSQLLMRRPDIVSAEKKLLAANEEAAAAHRDRFPRFSLTSRGGYASNEFQSLLKSDFFIWSVVGNLTGPIFDGQRLKSQSEIANQDVEIAEANYQQMVLYAFQEVESGIKNDQILLRQLDLYRESVKQSKEAEDLALEQYHRGLTNYSAVLDAQRQSFSAQRSQITAHYDQIVNRINLYLALGGPAFSAAEEK